MAETLIDETPKKSHKRGPGRPPKPQLPTLTNDQLLQLIASLTQAPAGSPDLALAIEGMKALTAQASRQVEDSKPKNNADHLHKSVFDFPEGAREAAKVGKVKALKYQVFFCGGLQSAEQLTPTEVDLYNSFTTSKEARAGHWKAILTPHGVNGMRLFVNVPALTNDDLMNLPPLTQILSELLYGQEMTDPMSQLAMIQALQKEVATLKAGAA